MNWPFIIYHSNPFHFVILQSIKIKITGEVELWFIKKFDNFSQSNLSSETKVLKDF